MASTRTSTPRKQRGAADPASRHPTIPASGAAVAPGRAAIAGPWIVRIAALWVLAGAVAKALTGTPAELPSPILALDVDPFVVIATAVVVETLVAIVALASPRRGWLPLAFLLGVFITVLVLHIRGGGEHCGCFGGAMAVPAWVMLAIDGMFLAGVIVAAIAARGRGESSRPEWPQRLALATSMGLAAGLALGWYASARLVPLRPRETQTAGATASAPIAGSSRAATPVAIVPVASPTGSAAPSAPQPNPPPSEQPAIAWRMPQVIPDQVILRPLQWVGKRLADTELGRWTDTSAFPHDATLIIYYLSCNHCAAHLRELADQQDASPDAAPNYVLVQLPTPSAYTGRLFVDRMPRGVRAVLPDQVKAYVITPPWDVFISGGVVSGAERIKWSGETGG